MGFGFINRRINPLVGAVLRSPAHRVLSGKLLLLSVTGRRSGEPHTFPVGYETTPTGVTIQVGAPAAKVWWRNLRSPAPVKLLIAGERRIGTGQAIESEGDVRVEVLLDG